MNILWASENSVNDSNHSLHGTSRKGLVYEKLGWSRDDALINNYGVKKMSHLIDNSFAFSFKKASEFKRQFRLLHFKLCPKSVAQFL